MDELLSAIAALVSLVSAEKVQAIAARIRRTDASKAASTLPSVVGTPVASAVVEQLAMAWIKTEVSSDELALMILSAGHVYTKAMTEQSTELVWTGPTTPFVSARRTEQAVMQVINSSKKSLFITSFVAYDVPTISEALRVASKRGVVVKMLMELSEEKGGTISFDSIEKMKKVAPSVELYVWRNKKDAFAGGRVHAKVVVADRNMCFITSANLTGHAMEKNIELGVLIRGGQIPLSLNQHLESLITTKIIEKEI